MAKKKKGHHEAVRILANTDQWDMEFDTMIECAQFFGMRTNGIRRLINERQNVPASKNPDGNKYEDIWLDELVFVPKPAINTKQSNKVISSNHERDGKTR